MSDSSGSSFRIPCLAPKEATNRSWCCKCSERTPIPLAAKKARIEIPEVDKEIGFDLQVGDWVSPYSKGMHRDFVFEARRRWVAWSNFDASVTVSFPAPGDGILPVHIPLDQG